MSEYPGITKAALAIAYDNGGINCVRSEKQMRRELGKWIARQPNEPLPAIDGWLSGLSDEDLEIVCAGDQEQASLILQGSPPFTDKLLTDYFNEVC